MTDFIEIEVDEDEVMRGFDIQERWAKQVLKNFLDDLADKGVEILHGNTPKWTGYSRRHVDRSGISWKPGGPGGGGTYEIVVGIKAGTSYHPVYPNIGTGMYGQFTSPIQSPTGKLMYFYSIKLGHVISMYQVAGQKPQHYLYDSWQDLAIFTEIRLLSVDPFN